VLLLNSFFVIDPHKHLLGKINFWYFYWIL